MKAERREELDDELRPEYDLESLELRKVGPGRRSAMPAQPVPEGYHTATPYLIVHDATAALAFYESAFGATELLRLPAPDDKIMHAEIMIGDSVVMLADENVERGFTSPRTLGGTASSILLYVEDVDRQFQQAKDVGAQTLRDVEDQVYGDRSGTLLDPFGHLWTLATHVEDVPPEEIERRFEAMLKP